MGLSVFLRTLSSETTNDPIVHPRKIRHIAWLLLAAVLWYHCSLSLFYHTHTVDGVAVTHSHPYTGTPDAPRHAHSAAQFAAIAALAAFVATVAALMAVGAVSPQLIALLRERQVRPLHPALLRSHTLRGPPCRMSVAC